MMCLLFLLHRTAGFSDSRSSRKSFPYLVDFQNITWLGYFLLPADQFPFLMADI